MGVITRATAESDARATTSSDGFETAAHSDPFLQNFTLGEGWNLDAEDLLTALQTVAVIVALASRGTK